MYSFLNVNRKKLLTGQGKQKSNNGCFVFKKIEKKQNTYNQLFILNKKEK